MKRTISIMLGKGSPNHNSRKFIAKNVCDDRVKNNIEYRHRDDIEVYHELFDEALKKYNEKQTRNDRKIKNYYEKIKRSKQEKLFHELIVQVGNEDDMPCVDEELCALAVKILDDYYQGFEKRNPNLRVFNAHMHLDESTPHLHIDFIPFVTGSKRGLETRVSLKQAMYTQGFKGRSDKKGGLTESAEWVNSEKEYLAKSMEKYGVVWNKLGTKNIHKDVATFKKEQRLKELNEIENKISNKIDKLIEIERNIDDIEYPDKLLEKFEHITTNDLEIDVDKPGIFTSAKTYKTNVVDKVITRLKSLLVEAISLTKYAIKEVKSLKSLLNKQIKISNEYKAQFQASEDKVYDLEHENKELKSELSKLKDKIDDFAELIKYYGKDKIQSMLSVAKDHNKQVNKTEIIIQEALSTKKESKSKNIEKEH